jgi:hypothetical protein
LESFSRCGRTSRPIESRRSQRSPVSSVPRHRGGGTHENDDDISLGVLVLSAKSARAIVMSVYLTDTVRPQGFTPSRRFDPARALWLCFTPHPPLGFLWPSEDLHPASRNASRRPHALLSLRLVRHVRRRADRLARNHRECSKTRFVRVPRATCSAKASLRHRPKPHHSQDCGIATRTRGRRNTSACTPFRIPRRLAPRTTQQTPARTTPTSEPSSGQMSVLATGD